MQACMRMRLLGKGHAVSFWASNEVHTQINSSRQEFDATVIYKSDDETKNNI
jgi:hypothetical protein